MQYVQYRIFNCFWSVEFIALNKLCKDKGKLHGKPSFSSIQLVKLLFSCSLKYLNNFCHSILKTCHFAIQVTVSRT